MSAGKKLTFEEALERLEEITAEMESTGVSLEQSIDLYTEGLKLAQECHKKLEAAEQKIKIIAEKNGTAVEEAFSRDSSEE